VPALWTLVAAFLALRGGRALDRSIYLATGGLVLVLSLIETWHRMAYDDELTGLPARRALTEALDRLGGTYAVAMVDLDHFKRFNDEHGHDVGDQLLRMVGARLAEVGGGGRAYRYGGEEFAVLFPESGADAAKTVAQRIRKALAAREIHADGHTFQVTVSVGVADTDGLAPDDRTVLVHRADRALYKAKEEGRNRVVVWRQ
jgi:diguanylate cyclase (GGDEF)-like protein